ncbi:uncharacterized protein DS421_11g330930 [Arachis hypogaea]|nr:uncharacterized protein DS421_11g330930 [Arachis hypogaea]
MNPLRFWCSGSPPLPPESLAAAPTVAPFGFGPCCRAVKICRHGRRSSGLSFCHLRPYCHRVPLPGAAAASFCDFRVRIRFAYATCSGFCFRESKPSRVLIVGDFGQSEKSSVDTLGLSFAC